MTFQECTIYNECQEAYAVVSNVLLLADFPLHKAKDEKHKLDFTLFQIVEDSKIDKLRQINQKNSRTAS